MTYPTRQTVDNPTDGTLELVHIVLVDAPAAAVRRPAVERVVDRAFRLLDRFGKMRLVQLLADKSLDFALLSKTTGNESRFRVIATVNAPKAPPYYLYNTFTAVDGVTVRAAYCRILAVLDRADQALLAEGVQTVPQHDALVRLKGTEADRTLEWFDVRN